ncbi:MAG TPA: hypothetical protein VF516_41140 [Kofleriaceae bacterium]
MRRAIALGLTLALAAPGCHRDGTAAPQPNPEQPTRNQAPPDKAAEGSMTNTELEQKLVHDELGMTFVWPQHDNTIAAIWSLPGNPRLLESVLNDPHAAGRARFIAAEVLFAKDFSFIDRTSRDGLARLYAEALVKRYTGQANAWGLLWDGNDAGPAGGRFILLGDDAIPALVHLLDDTTVVDWYAGSEEATVGNGYKYRIKDFAAFYLGRITGKPIAFHDEPAARDREIAQLRDTLRNRGK